MYQRRGVTKTNPSAFPPRAFSFRYPRKSVFWMFWNIIQSIIILLLQTEYRIILSNDNLRFMCFWSLELILKYFTSPCLFTVTTLYFLILSPFSPIPQPLFLPVTISLVSVSSVCLLCLSVDMHTNVRPFCEKLLHKEERMASPSQHLCTSKYSYKCPLKHSLCGGGNNLFTTILHTAW